MYGAGSSTTSIYSIDTASGSGSVLGDMGFFSSGDLAFFNDNFFLAADTGSSDTLVSINQNTYAGTAVGSIGFDYVYGLATGDDNLLYGLSDTNVLAIDPIFGTGSIINNYAGAGIGVSYGSSFIAEASAPVPEPSTIILLSTGLLGMFGAIRRKFNIL